jgi:hypothetical protein
VHIKKYFGLKHKQRRCRILVNNTNGVQFGVHNNNVENLQRAILERVYLVKGDSGFQTPPKPNAPMLKERLRKFYEHFSRKDLSTTPFTSSEFLATYWGRKRSAYERALQSLTDKIFVNSDARLRAFVKAEKTNLSSKQNPAPRVIQPRDIRFNATIGPYIKKIEYEIYHEIANIFGATTVSKGLNNRDLGNLIQQKWEKFDNPLAIGLDASRFDQHVSVDMLRWEHSVYRLYYTHDVLFDRLLQLQILNHGVGVADDGVIHYTVEGCRMSGDMNTALGNCLIMCAMIYSYMAPKNVKYELINNGDDCVLFLEKDAFHKLHDLSTWFHEMGFTMKIEKPVSIIEEVVFCQTQPVWDGTQYIMVRDPRIVLTKDLISFLPLSCERDWKAQCQAISDSGVATYGHIPILGQFYSWLDMKVKPYANIDYFSGLHTGARGLSYGLQAPVDDCRVSFWRAFDIIPERQIEVENYYAQCLKGSYSPGSVENSFIFNKILPSEY